ncbi:hypothetical protein [Streptomyces sp. SAI-170]|uniref:hypothetical protein n=1 Tax=Streptomyces sp. SAI-170 TaxID=3377729 RepID=UPI003C7BF0C7
MKRTMISKALYGTLAASLGAALLVGGAGTASASFCDITDSSGKEETVEVDVAYEGTEQSGGTTLYRYSATQGGETRYVWFNTFRGDTTRATVYC